MTETPEGRMRLDKWLWAARFFKTRDDAATAVQLGSDALCAPLQRLLRRVLAETAVNLGQEAVWPQALVLNVSIGGRQGKAEIFWNSTYALAWARRAIREKP